MVDGREKEVILFFVLIFSGKEERGKRKEGRGKRKEDPPPSLYIRNLVENNNVCGGGLLPA
jgi:hypothetical protein